MSSYTDTGKPVSEMRQNFELLEKHIFFSVLPHKAIKLLAFAAERQQFGRNEVVFEEGEDFGAAFLVLEGKLVLGIKKGGNVESIRHFQPGEIIGMTSLLSAQPSLFQLTADLETKVLTVARKHFIKIQEQFPETVTASYKTIFQEVYQWERRNLKKSEQDGMSLPGVTVL